MNHNLLHDLLFGVTVVCYFLGSVVFPANLFLKDTRVARAGVLLATVGIFFHTASIILRAAELGMTPFAGPAEAWSILGWAVVAIFLSISVRRMQAIGAFALPAGLVGLLIAAAVASPNRPILSGVSTWALALHVPASIISIGAFVVAFGCAIGYLVQDHLLREKRFGGIMRSLPPLDVLDRTSYWLVVFGFCLLTVALVSGAILARDAWATTWTHHPKTYASVLLWLTYAAYLYIRGVARWRGRRTHSAVVIAVVVLLLLYGGALLLQGNSARYAGQGSRLEGRRDNLRSQASSLTSGVEVGERGGPERDRESMGALREDVS